MSVCVCVGLCVCVCVFRGKLDWRKRSVCLYRCDEIQVREQLRELGYPNVPDDVLSEFMQELRLQVSEVTSRVFSVGSSSVLVAHHRFFL